MPLFRNPVRIVGVVRFFGIPFEQSFPQGGALLYYLYRSFIRIYLSAVVASAFRNPLKSSACRFFGIPFGQSSPQEQFPILIILMSFFPNLSVRSRRTDFRDLPESSACRFFGIPFGQSFPLRRFTHCGTADRRATNVPRRNLQTMFRSVTIFMRSSVSGNSLLPNRFSDRAHNFSNAHHERITAAASFFFF